MSFDNYNRSNTLKDTKYEILEHQKALKNILVNSDYIHRRYKLKYREFVLITLLLFIIIVVCSILLLFKKSTWVIWIALNVMRLVIVLLIIKLLTYFIYQK